MIQQQVMYGGGPNIVLMGGSNTVVIGAAPSAQVMDPINQDGAVGYNVIRRSKLPVACCACCVPNMEWNISEYHIELAPGPQPPALLSAIEESPFCCRFCCHMGGRQSKYRVFAGHVTKDESAVQQPLLTFHKNLTCCRCMGCFSLPFYRVADQHGFDLGTVKFACNPCVPTMVLEVPTGNPKYRVQPETCCGCCIQPRCGDGGGPCCRVNYLVRTMENIPLSDARISQLWYGAVNDILLTKTHYACKYPPGADRATRATLLAANLLLDMAINEKDEQDI